MGVGPSGKCELLAMAHRNCLFAFGTCSRASWNVAGLEPEFGDRYFQFDDSRNLPHSFWSHQQRARVQ